MLLYPRMGVRKTSASGTFGFVGSAFAASKRVPIGMVLRLRCQVRWRPSDPTYATSNTVPKPSLRCTVKLMFMTDAVFISLSHATTEGGEIRPCAFFTFAMVSNCTTGVWTSG